MKTFTIGKKKIVLKEEWMVGFITTWIVGLLAHAYRFFNFLPIWDSIYNFTGVGSTYTLGRWFLGYAGLITSMFDLPWVNGAFSLFYISIVVILLTEMFEIKNKGMIVLCAAILCPSRPLCLLLLICIRQMRIYSHFCWLRLQFI